MMNNLSKLLIFFLFFELLSLYAFLAPSLMSVIFVFLCLSFFLLALKYFDITLLVLLAEIFISSFGYLFWFEQGGFKLSVRIMFWLLILVIWLTRTAVTSLKNKKLLWPISKNEISFQPKDLSLQSKFFVLFLITIFFSSLNGYFLNDFKNFFFDVNAWLFFLLILPIYDVFLGKKLSFYQNLSKVFMASVIWLSIKTLALLYIFSHQFSFTRLIYKWVRDTRVGEITRMDGDYYRIFIQSHIFILVALLLMCGIFYYTLTSKNKNRWSLIKNKIFNIFSSKDKRLTGNKIIIFTLTSIFLSITLLNFSRSNWLGLIVATVFFLWGAKYFFTSTWKNYFQTISLLSLSLVFSILIIFIVTSFPFPSSTTSSNTASLLADRAKQVSGEAGVSSRWNLLDVLKKEIFQAPIIGQGFGSTVTYTSNDPRVRENNPSGEYTTYAFEWGWIDIWIKTGLIGFFAYIGLIFSLLIKSFQIIKTDNDPIIFGLALGLIAISSINFFSPYLNHPLGITYIVIYFSIIETYNIKYKNILKNA